MTVLYLGPESPVSKFLVHAGFQVYQSEAPIEVIDNSYDWLISYGYRYIISDETLRHFGPGRAVNLHISYLPWNRGADPNFWSWVDDTPRGVTIHELDAGIDTGPVCHRRLVPLIAEPPIYDRSGKEVKPAETLASSYQRLHEEMVKLFIEAWPMAYKRGKFMRSTQPKEPGSYHTKADGAELLAKLSLGWNTPVTELKR